MLPIVYVTFTVLVILILLLLYRKVLHHMAIPARERSRKFVVLVGILFGWISYLNVLSVTDVLKDTSMPPKFPLLVFLPLTVGFIVFYRRSLRSKVLKEIPRTWPVYFQSFRIGVELMLLYTFYAGIIPQGATFEGLNFDVVMGVSALFVGAFVVQRNGSKLLQCMWNILGILMVAFVGFIIATSMYFPEMWGSEVPLVSMQFIEMPYLLLAGVLAPLAIFMHVISLVQLRRTMD